MTKAEQFQVCLDLAKGIVSAYRTEAPHGCDPQNSGIAAAGLIVGLIGAGTSAYQANKANKARTAALTGGHQSFNPQQVDLASVLQNLLGSDSQNFGAATQLAGATNKFNFQEMMRYIKKVQPNFKPIQQQVGANALSFAQGQLPSDTVNSIGRAASERGIEGGYGYGSQGARTGALANLNLRNLGLTSLDLTKYGTNLGMQVNQSAKGLLPNMSSSADWLFSPEMGLKNAEFNTDWINKALLANASSSNALGQNIADSSYASSLNQAATVQQAGNQLSSLLGQYGANRGQSGWGGNSLATGNRGTATFNGTAVPQGKLA